VEIFIISMVKAQLFVSQHVAVLFSFQWRKAKFSLIFSPSFFPVMSVFRGAKQVVAPFLILI